MSNYFKDSFYLTESQLKELNCVISEEMGINKSVTYMLQNIIDIFNEKYSKVQYIKENDFMSKKQVTFQYKWKNNFINFIFNCYNSLSVNYYQTMVNKYKIGDGSTNEIKKTITINLGYINGTLKTPVSIVLRHEEKHIYQLLMGRQINNWHRGTLGKTIYQDAVKNLKMGKNCPEKLYHISFLLYTQSDSETDSFINQLYQELIEANGLEEDKVIKNSSVYKYYIIGKKFLSYIKNNKEITIWKR